jgi:O-acetyl-ADP-ribose deacetylase (regulator of RNase III)
MIIREEQRDLFTVPKGHILVHCISADLAMGAGIAKEFTKRGIKAQLQKDYQDIEVGECLVSNTTGWRAELNLVTKEKYWQKPTYKTMRMALENTKSLYEELMSYENVKLAMPKIGCGLDRLQWDKVKVIIEEVFADTDVEILVCVK